MTKFLHLIWLIETRHFQLERLCYYLRDWPTVWVILAKYVTNHIFTCFVELLHFVVAILNVSGYFCESPSTTPASCPPGTYREATGGTALLSCAACPAGYKCTGTTITPDPCLIGEYSPSGQSVCSSCSAGFYCHQEGTSDAEMALNRCPKSMTCPLGTDHVPTGQIDPCPVGHYCPEAVAAPVPCIPGYYNPSLLGEVITDCLECPAGRFCSGGLDAPDGLCQKGHWCLAGSDSPTQNACAPGYYNSVEGERLAAACTPCPAGTICLTWGMEEPLPCPMGFYCVESSTAAEGCPPGLLFNNYSSCFGKVFLSP